MTYGTQRIAFHQLFPKIVFLVLLGVCSGCGLRPAPSLPITTLPAPTPTIDTFYTWTDEIAVMNGICFESALDAVGRIFVLKNDEALSRFYDLADNSRLCRRPVRRNPFDFSSGRVLAGLWRYGVGCTARHDVINVQRDDAAKTILITLHFVTEGDCRYELVRPFWIGLVAAVDYDISIVVQSP